MKIGFYKHKDFGRGISSGLRWQKCYHPSRTHGSELSIGLLIWKWQFGVVFFFDKLTKEQQEYNEKYFR